MANDENPLHDYYQREFAELERITSHRALAAAAALYLCAIDGQSPPHWVVQEASELLCDLLANKPKKKGRAAGHVARYKQDLIELERWDAIYGIRQSQRRLYDELRRIRERGWDVNCPNGLKSRVAERMKLQAWLGRSFPRAVECAAMTLRGRDAYCSTSTMLKTYKKMQRHIKRLGNRQSPSHWLMDERFLMRIGFKSQHERNKGTKTLPLWTLE